MKWNEMESMTSGPVQYHDCTAATWERMGLGQVLTWVQRLGHPLKRKKKKGAKNRSSTRIGLV